MADDFGDRMKFLEGMEAKRKSLPLVPVCVRLDGKCFSKFTKGLRQPYDERMSTLMRDTAKFMVEETNAAMGYTQSDEISLVFYSDNYDSQIFFDGRIQKMVSVLASMCSVYFNKGLPTNIPEKAHLLPIFDCRVWTVPNMVEATNALLWREQDATKNSIASAAQSVYSHKQLHKKSGKEMQEMLFKKGINWNDYPSFFKRGTFIQRRKVHRKFTTEELERLPEKHAARKDPDLVIERTEVRELEMPPFVKVTNRVQVVFEGADPVVAEEVGA